MADVIGQHPSSTGAHRPCTWQHAPGRTVHRYYDPTTGEFLTVDPDVAATGQPYYYASGNPVNETDPSGQWSHGYCLSGSAELLALVAAASGTVCAIENYQSQPELLTSTSNGLIIKPHNLGDFLTDLDSAVENGLGAVSVTASFYIAFTDSLSAQTGSFGSYFGSLGIGKYFAVQGTYFYGDGDGNGKCGTTIRGGTTGGMIGISAGVALGIPIPVSGGSSVYDMSSHPLTSIESDLVLGGIRAADSFNPLANIFNGANSIQENV